MEGRKKRKREEQLLEEARNKARTERPKIADQFADLKQDLAMVSERHRHRPVLCIMHRSLSIVHHQRCLYTLHLSTLQTDPFHPYNNTIPYHPLVTGYCRAMGCYPRNRRPHPQTQTKIAERDVCTTSRLHARRIHFDQSTCPACQRWGGTGHPRLDVEQRQGRDTNRHWIGRSSWYSTVLQTR